MVNEDNPKLQIRRKPVPARQSSQQHGLVEEISTITGSSTSSTSDKSVIATSHNYASEEHGKSTSKSTAVELATGTDNDYPVPLSSPTRGRLDHSTIWTRPSSLLAFSALLLSILVALFTIAKLSHSKNGYDVSQRMVAHPYAWKYGPTAVLTFIIALWRQTDRHTRLAQPWLKMSETTAPVHDNLLLDYTSPLLPVALWNSLQNKHWRVTTTMTVFMVLKVIVAFSTSLFLVRDTWSTLNGVTIALQNPLATTIPISAIGYLTNEVYGNIVDGLELPLGVATNATFQTLSTSNQFPSSAVITTGIGAAFPNMICDTATTIANFTITKASITLTSVDVNYSSLRCNGSLSLGSLSCNIYNQSDCTAATYYITAGKPVDCSIFEQPPGGGDNPDAFVFVLLALSPSATSAESVVDWSSAAVCHPTYAVEQVDLVQAAQNVGSNAGVYLSDPKTPTNNFLPDYTPSNLTLDVANCFTNIFEMPASTPPDSSASNYDNVDPYFNLMLADMSVSDIGQLRNVSVLVASATHLYQRFASHLLASRLSSAVKPTSQGSYTFKTARLFILDSNAWVVGVLLLATSVSVLGLAVVTLRGRGLQPPISLSQLSAYVRPTSVTATTLDSIGHLTDEKLQSHMLDYEAKVASVSQSRHVLQLRHWNEVKVVKNEQQKTHQNAIAQYWIPLSARKWFISLCVGIPIIEIIALEVLQHISDHRNGFSDMRASLRLSQTLAATLPAIIMLSTAALYSATEWAVNIFAPFSRARKQSVPLKHLDRNNADSLAPVTIVRTIKRRQYGVSIITVSTILGSFLTIMASGLYSLNQVTSPVNVTASTTTQFNTSVISNDQAEAVDLFNLMQLHNASSPIGTYDDFAYPLIQLNESNPVIRNATLSTTTVDINVPVLRAHLNCSVVPEKDMTYSVDVADESGNDTIATATLFVTMDLPRACQFSSGNYEYASQLTVNYTLQVFDFSSGPFNAASIVEASGISRNKLTTAQEGWPSKCPSLAFVVGTFDNDTNVKDKTVLVCTQLQNEVPATIRLNLPDLSIDASTVPSFDESETKTVSVYQYPFAYYFGQGLEALTDNTSTLDPFYQALVNMTGLSITSMTGADKAIFFYIQTEWLYRKFMAQVFGQSMRIHDPNTSTIDWTLPTLPIRTQLRGSLLDTEHMRVFQNKESKIALQALLASLIVCVIAAYAIVDVKATLPHNPSSIAGILSLLVGSHFAEECAHIADLCDDDTEPGRRLQDREVEMGWWQEVNGGSLRFGLEFTDSLD